MKKLIIVSLALFAGNLFAQELRLGDLNFFQKEKSIRVTSELRTSAGDTSFKQKGITPVERDTDFDRITWENEVLYGIEDRFNAGLALTYALKNRFNNTKFNQSGFPQSPLRDYDEEGISDPTFRVNYRLSQDKVYLDAFTGLTVSIGDREQGGATNLQSQDGNFKQGHHSLLAGIAAGQKVMKDFEWRASLAFDYHAAGKFKYRETNTLNNKSADMDGGLDWILGAQGQYRFLKNFAVAGNLEFRRVGERDINFNNQSNQDVDENRDSYNVTSLGLTGKYNVSESVLVSLGINRTFSYEVDGQYDAVGTVTDFSTDYSGVNEFRIGADLLF